MAPLSGLLLLVVLLLLLVLLVLLLGLQPYRALPAQNCQFQLALLPGHVDGQVGQGLGELLAVRGVQLLLELFEACVRGGGLFDHCQNHLLVEDASPVLPPSKQWRRPTCWGTCAMCLL